MLRRIILAVLLLAAMVIAIWRTLPPAALPAGAPAEAFSAGRAAETIRAIARSPRLVGSPAYETARYYLLMQMAALGLTTETQDLAMQGAWVENTLGRLEGRSSREAILLVAHLDSVAETPGAMDNASGVAEVLEMVRALKAGPELENTIIVLFSGPEENCCYGARAFAKRHPWAKDVRLVVNVDAGGVSGPSILAATGPEEGWLIREMAQVLPDPIGSSAIEAFGNPATDYSLELRQDGFSGFDFNLSWVKRIHTPLDNVDHLNLASIQHQGEHMLAVVRHFGNISLDYPREPRPVYFDLLGLTLVNYPVSLVIPLFLGLVLIMSAALFLGFQRKALTMRGMAFGGLAFLLSLLTVPLLLMLIQLAIIQPLLATGRGAGLSNQLTGDSLLSNSLRWGSLIFALPATGLWFAYFRKVKRVELDELVSGTYILLFAGAGVTSLAFPAISYLFLWALLFGLTALALQFSMKAESSQVREWIHLVATIAAAVVSILLFVPGILMATMSIDIRMIYLVPVLVTAMAGSLIAPLGEFRTVIFAQEMPK